MNGKKRFARRSIPDPFFSFEEAEKFHHRDLPQLTELQRWAERTLVQNQFAAAVLRGAPESHWLAERLAAINEEIIARREEVRRHG